jgi:hypothetical protein
LAHLWHAKIPASMFYADNGVGAVIADRKQMAYVFVSWRVVVQRNGSSRMVTWSRVSVDRIGSGTEHLLAPATPALRYPESWSKWETIEFPWPAS